MNLLLSLLFFTNLGFSKELSCEGFVEILDNNNQLKIDKKVLVTTFASPIQLQLATDIGPIHFSFSTFLEEDDNLLMITEGPNYTKGITSRGTWNENGLMRIARVDGPKTYRLVCKKNPPAN